MRSNTHELLEFIDVAIVAAAFAWVEPGRIALSILGAVALNLVVAIVFAGIWLYFLNLPSIRTIFAAPTSGFPIVGHALDPTYQVVGQVLAEGDLGGPQQIGEAVGRTDSDIDAHDSTFEVAWARSHSTMPATA